MPWLDKGNVLFIHIPRCGGTSITKFHRVDYKARQGLNCYHKFGIIYYYYRYKLLETSNFPLLTIENAMVVLQTLVATFLYFFGEAGLIAPYFIWSFSSLVFLFSTFIFTAPYTMRYGPLRRLTMYTFHYVLCKLGADTRYMVGTNNKGYLFHLTAERALRYGYVTKNEVETTSFSIVRNPYSRMVSMYHYNKRFYESFAHFVKDFHQRCMERYHMKGQTDSVDIYCHVLPMHAYTHFNGEKLVNTIIKQEDLKRLVSNGWKNSGVPVPIQEALTGIPHANRRPRKIAWQNYYTQETMDMVIDMYEKDFELFGYSKSIPNRPDLTPSKILLHKQLKASDPSEVRVEQVGEDDEPSGRQNSHFIPKHDSDELAPIQTENAAPKTKKSKVRVADDPGVVYTKQSSDEKLLTVT